MDTATYQERMERLGIRRGALAEGFPVEDGTSTAAQKQPKVFHRRIGERVPEPEAPDLSHLNPASSALIAQQVSDRARRRRMEARG